MHANRAEGIFRFLGMGRRAVLESVFFNRRCGYAGTGAYRCHALAAAVIRSRLWSSTWLKASS